MKLRVVAILFASVLAVVFGEKQCEDQRKCVPLADCPEYRPYVGQSVKTWPPAVRNEAKAQFCGRATTEHGASIIKVCCQSTSVVKTGRQLLNLTACGKSSRDRIAHGEIAEVFEFPWMALLGGINGDFHCGGSLIAESFVLTAASCNRITVDFVRVGETDLSTQIDCNIHQDEEDCADPYQDIKVAKFIKHQSYSAGKRKNDIALIKLVHPVQLNDNVLPICLPLPEMLPKDMSLKMVVSGWGHTEDVDGISPQLRFANVPIIEHDQCQRSVRLLSDVYSVDESQVCAGADEDLADNCLGDSGGPLQYFGRRGYVIHGVVAWGLNTCGIERAPGVYTRVSHYLDWIIDHLK